MNFFKSLLNPCINISTLYSTHRQQLREQQITIFHELFSTPGFLSIRSEVQRLSHLRVRRDIVIPESGYSPRRMSTIGASIIKRYSVLIPKLYFDFDFMQFIREIAEDDILPAPDVQEDMVCNFLHLPGDLHGEHKDTYPYAFNIVIKSPPMKTGGELLLWNHKDNSEAPAKFSFSAGDCYLMRTDLNLHSVSPLLTAEARTVLNFAYSNRFTINRPSYSSSLLYTHD